MPVDPRIAEVAAAVVAALVPYLTEGGKAAARKAGEVLFGAIKRRFSGRTIAEAALEEFKNDPADEENRQTLESQIRKALKQDADFLAELTELLKAVPPQVTATEGGIATGGDMDHSAAVTGKENNTAVADRGGTAVAGGSIQAERIYATNIVSGVQIVTSSDHSERAKREGK